MQKSFHTTVRYSIKGDEGRIIESVVTDDDDNVTIKLNTPASVILKKPNDDSVLDR